MKVLPLPRCVLLIEGCEESGSFDLPAYLDHLGAAHRHARSRRVSRRRVRRLRASVAVVFVAGVADRHARSVGADRRRALRRCERHRAVELSHPALAARSDRRRGVRPHDRRAARADRRADAGRRALAGRVARRRHHRAVSVATGHVADGAGRGRTRAEQHVAAHAQCHRAIRRAAGNRGRQHVASVDVGEAVDPAAADARCETRIATR